MSSKDEGNIDLDAALEQARVSVKEIANLELAVNGRDELTIAEAHLLSFGVQQGWLTCLEYLRAAGLIDINYH